MPATSRAQGEDTRERILAAALESFAENGFEGSTTRAIAARAGVNLGLIKYYFDSKARLWRAAVDRAFEGLAEAMGSELEAALERGDAEGLRVLIQRFVRFVAQRPEFVRLMHEEGKRPGPRMRWLVDRHVAPIHEAITRAIARAQESGTIRADIAPLHLHYILVGACTLLFHQSEECKRLSGVDPCDEAVADAHAEAIARLLLQRPA